MANNLSSASPLRGKEYIFPGEDVIIAQMITEMEAELRNLYKKGKMLRQIHTKMHGCVVGDFTVVAGLPLKYRVGVFKEPKTYPAWIRFSNSATVPKPDSKKDIRGCAIKLMKVPGDKLLNDEFDEQTQDFLLMSSETFFAKNLVQFRGLLKASTAKSKLKLIAYFLNPFHIPMMLRVKKSMIACRHPFAVNYWSTQAYQFGPDDQAVKYKLVPSMENKLVVDNTTDPDYLRKNMVKTLKRFPVSFDFYVQLQEDPVRMPVEDPTVKWTSQFMKVAEISIRVQEFDTPAQNDFGDNLSFNSWHSLPEHRPLGSFNRARKRVYEALSKFRHDKNKLPVFEPDSVSVDDTNIPAMNERDIIIGERNVSEERW